MKTLNNEKKTRAPIITIAGHIDHGKTTLLNYIQKNKRPKKEYGGITQYIKAYNVKTEYGFMTFLDTPGHFVFSSIRINSIKHTDIVLLIIAADDGVKPQTIEIINIAKKFEKPVVVAINKIDKSTENKEKIINELSNYNMIPEEWGGDTLISPISAKTGFGVNKLIEYLNLQTEILTLTFNNKSKAEGIIIDSNLDKGKGLIATIIVKNGILKKGNILFTKNNWCKVKTITNGINNINEVYPTQPVKITGFTGTIDIGEKFNVLENEKEAENLLQKSQKSNIKKEKNYNLDELIVIMRNKENKKYKELNIIIKADFQGSINVLKELINKIDIKNFKLTLTRIGIGDLNISDIKLAINTKAIVIGFNVKCDIKTKIFAKNNLIKINIFNVIYEITDYIKQITENIVEKDEKNVIGIAEVKKIFKKEKLNLIAGCIITYGKIKQNMTIRIFRKKIVVHEGSIESMKILKDNVKEVKMGNECGISIKNCSNINENDIIKAYS